MKHLEMIGTNNSVNYERKYAWKYVEIYEMANETTAE